MIEALIALKARRCRRRFLLGNHDSYVRDYLHDPDWYDRTYHWLHDNMGGNATLASYGVPDAGWANAGGDPRRLRRRLPATRTWRSSTPAGSIVRVGGYLFVHAGIRPGVPLEAQTRDDLIWIREPFLTSTADFGFKVVHGHTIVPTVEHHPNRIAIDTGAVRTDVLSCLVLEGSDVALLAPDGRPRRLPQGSGIVSWRNLWLRR